MHKASGWLRLANGRFGQNNGQSCHHAYHCHTVIRFLNMLDNYLKLLHTGHFRNLPTHDTTRICSLDYLVIWVLGGKGYAATEGRQVQARAGHLLTFNKNQGHSYRTDQQEPWDIVWLHFDGIAAGEVMKRMRAHADAQFPAVELGLDHVILQRFLELIQTVQMESNQPSMLADSMLWTVLGMMIHRLEHRAPHPGIQRQDQVRRVLTYVQDHLADPMTLNDLARQAGMSVSQLSRLFRKMYQLSPMQYVIGQRIARASLLLGETTLSIKQVAAQTGFYDPYYFSRQFRRVLGLPPKAYRLEQQARDRAVSVYGAPSTINHKS